jgi:phosphoadenosine phosphosulfate reductase
MYSYTHDPETGGLLLNNSPSQLSKEPRPVYSQELDILGFDKYWTYEKSDTQPLMWAESNNYIYRGRLVAKMTGGSIKEKPQIEIIENPEADGSIIGIDIPRMVEKNADLLEKWTQQSIKRIYETYEKYRRRIDIFYVAFSGGKDSLVTLDLIQRSLPHNSFKVLFGDTGMEFPDTYETVDYIEEFCNKNGIDFIRAHSQYKPEETWKRFGPPATVNRWCCSVHKTAPQILALREITGKANFTGMAFVGVRASESLSRSGYEYVSVGEKHKGQYSCNPILEWNSAELYLYIYSENLYINKAYTKGNRRAGCLVCPRAAERSDYFAHTCYPVEFEKLVDAIKFSYTANFNSEERLNQFVENGGWKARKNGRDISVKQEYQEIEDKENTKLIIKHPTTNWKEWIKTVGVLMTTTSPYTISYKGQTFVFEVHEEEGLEVSFDSRLAKTDPTFIKLLKNVFKKAATCMLCRVCEADCHNGSLHMENGKVTIDDTCLHCSQCHKVEKGCLLFKSIEKPKGINNMKSKTQSLNCYSHHAPKMDWFVQFFKYKNEFDVKNSLGTNMFDFFKRFLRDAGLRENNQVTEFANLLDGMGLDNESTWALMLNNLAYTPQINWLVRRLEFGDSYKKEYVLNLLVEDGAKESWASDIWSSFSRLADLPFAKVGFGEMNIEGKKPVSLVRIPWNEPDDKVILYCLYRFAEACDDYKQFTLKRIMDNDVEGAGITPIQLFGVGSEQLKTILKGLAINYPEFISVAFTLDLDNIKLKDEKTSKDVLTLF